MAIQYCARARTKMNVQALARLGRGDPFKSYDDSDSTGLQRKETAVTVPPVLMQDPRHLGSDSRPPQSKSWQKVWQLGLTIVLWLSLVALPGAPVVALDPSYESVLVFSHQRNWQFGREINFIYGPWGFLNSVIHLGANGAAIRLLWETVGRFLLAGTLVLLTRRFSRLRQAIVVGACVFFGWLHVDTMIGVFLTLGVVGGLMRRNATRAELGGWVIGLAFLSEFKFTYGLIAAIGVFAAAGLAAVRHNWRTSAGLAVGFPIAILGWWMAAGQDPRNLAFYLRYSLELTSGNNSAMMAEGNFPPLVCGLVLAAMGAGFVWRLLRNHSDRSFGCIASGFLALAWFVVWKHGFIRADTHLLDFFAYNLIVALAIPALCFPAERFHLCDLALPVCLLGIWCVDPGLLGHLPRTAMGRLRHNVAAMFRAARLPEEWQEAFRMHKEEFSLPAARRIVGNGSVDCYNFNQGVVLLNGLNYRPRPVFQSYIAYTLALELSNLHFYESRHSPDYLLCNFVSVDRRYPALDDAALVAELPRGYQTVLIEGDYLLLRKTRVLPANRLDRELIQSRTLALGEMLKLPAPPNGAIWIQADLPLSLLGKARALLYRTPIMTIEVTDQSGAKSKWQILPHIAEDGFLLQPLLANTVDFAAFIDGRVTHWIQSVEFEAPTGTGAYWQQPQIKLYALPQIRLQFEGDDGKHHGR